MHLGQMGLTNRECYLQIPHATRKWTPRFTSAPGTSSLRLAASLMTSLHGRSSRTQPMSVFRMDPEIVVRTSSHTQPGTRSSNSRQDMGSWLWSETCTES